MVGAGHPVGQRGPVRDGHAERVGGQCSGLTGVDRPADDTAGVHVEHDRAVHPSLTDLPGVLHTDHRPQVGKEVEVAWHETGGVRSRPAFRLLSLDVGVRNTGQRMGRAFATMSARSRQVTGSPNAKPPPVVANRTSTQ